MRTDACFMERGGGGSHQGIIFLSLVYPVDMLEISTYVDYCIHMASEHNITHFPPLTQHSYNSPNLPGLLPKSSQGSLGPTVLLPLLFPVKYGLRNEEGGGGESDAGIRL